jgi:plastocyanin
MKSRHLGWLGAAMVVAGIALLGASAALGSATGVSVPGGSRGGGMMGGGGNGRASAPGPGEAGFVAGTPAAPRVVRIVATPKLRFLPDVVAVQAGETITFEVTTMGPTVHEFMVGPATDVAGDAAGTPEVADIGMMQTRSLTYTFTGPGPFAFACHAPGHYEAGMSGTIAIQ